MRCRTRSRRRSRACASRSSWRASPRIREALQRHLDHLNTDITELNAFVTATLEYAVLERAEVALNIAAHDFTTIVPAVTESVKRGARSGSRDSLRSGQRSKGGGVRRPSHRDGAAQPPLQRHSLREPPDSRELRGRRAAALSPVRRGRRPRHPRSRPRAGVRTRSCSSGARRARRPASAWGSRSCKRIVEWHGGTARVEQSLLGGARFVVDWRAGRPTGA